MSTAHRISPLVLKIRDRVEKLAPAAHFPLWEWGGDSKRGTFQAGDATFSLRERAAELIYCRQQDRMHLRKIIARKIEQGNLDFIDPPSERVIYKELYVGIAEEFDPIKPLAEVKSERDL